MAHCEVEYLLGDIKKLHLYLLMACAFLMFYSRHLNCYQPDTQIPANDMLGHSPVYFRNQHMVSYDDLRKYIPFILLINL
jgi:hypothetical protein